MNQEYLKLFKNQEEYDAAATKPVVSHLVEEVEVIMESGSSEHEYVDLGLPSGTLWATMNIGAASISDYGDYYQYGKGTKQYFETSGQTLYSGPEQPLASSADTATQVWGSPWHMPTQAQLNELTANTTYEWTTINGVNGGKFTAANGKYVFFPSAGTYFNGTLTNVVVYCDVLGSNHNGSAYAYFLRAKNGSREVSELGYTGMGFSIRGVK